MRILRDKSELATILPRLESNFPRSLPVYHMVQHAFTETYAWPGMEIVVDQYPDFAVCIVRPQKNDKNFVPMMNGYQVFLYSENDEILRRMLFHEDVIDWTQFNIMFADITEPEHLQIFNEGRRIIGGTFEDYDDTEGYPTGERCYYFDLDKMHLDYAVPDGFREGILLPDHAEQMSIERNYGVRNNNEQFFNHMLSHNFPSFALFPHDSNLPAAYCLYKCEGTLGAAYVHHEYRGRGLYKVILRGILRELRDLGEKHVWAETPTSNLVSQKGLKGVGGNEFSENYIVHWINVWPGGKPT
ncbi:glycine N-acyltransferase-like [Paramacrobiotus metropolitanus]|uniref:glycine N-acyltransferase-like n=1 Tax=Paramacrobiotus metropolitanus TaxID=2943436 RepID=UPI002445C243|nr:glycine N-acyltransferase-like [Paramacrobiotus metropolitanus]